MGFALAHLKRGLPLAAALLTVCSVQAQRADSPPGQFIVFSSPDSGATLSNLPSLAPQPPESLNFGNTLEAPPAFDFSGPSPNPPLPAAMPVVSPAEVLRARDLLDKRENWMLLTPAEILGATTPEKIMGIQERDAWGRPKNPTASERYNERWNQAASAATNTDRVPAWAAFDKQPGALSPLAANWGYSNSPASPLLNPATDNQTFAGQNENSSWSKLFGSPAPAVTPSLPSDMERFRQLLKPGPAAAAEANTPTPTLNGIKNLLPQSALSSGLGQSALTPVGALFTPLNSGVGKPADLPKLPSIWSLSLTSPPAAAAWAPQPPPWLSPTPQPFAAPQRKF